MNTRNDVETGSYFGVEVEVLVTMGNCSLVRYDGKETIVDTVDLVFRQVLKKAA